MAAQLSALTTTVLSMQTVQLQLVESASQISAAIKVLTDTMKNISLNMRDLSNYIRGSDNREVLQMGIPIATVEQLNVLEQRLQCSDFNKALVRLHIS
jgi:hypothetical protein